MPAPHSLPLSFCPQTAAQVGLEEAVLLAVLQECQQWLTPQQHQGHWWYRVAQAPLCARLPFWSWQHISYLAQRLQQHQLLVLSAAPLNSSTLGRPSELQFTWLVDRSVQPSEAPFSPSPTLPQPPELPHRAAAPSRTRAGQDFNPRGEPISADWRPSPETLARIQHHNIPSDFVAEQVPEFVTYWRERGDANRAWGAKFLSHTLRKWRTAQDEKVRAEQRQAERERQRQEQPKLATEWQPSDEITSQLSQLGIPMSHIQECVTRFCAYYRDTGKTVSSWNMAFYTWAKDDWDQRETPFLPKKARNAMTADWQPAEHTRQYLASIGIDQQFLADCIPEFIHKWVEQGGYRDDWGEQFVQHVSKQWNYVEQGIPKLHHATVIADDWQPSASCIELLQTQCGIEASFIEAQIPEFVLYWRNRVEARHSWDNVFLRHIKHSWAQAATLPAVTNGTDDENTANAVNARSTRDRSVEEDLTDHSWAY